MVSKPIEKPAVAYSGCAVPGIDPALFELGATGHSDAERQTALAQLSLYEISQKSRFLGYQANQYDSYGDLAQYLTMHLNNIGDPFVTGNFTVNTKFMERPVLDYYAALWNARWPHNPDHPESYWGYVLTMGSTEGNLYGLWNARDYLAGKVLLDDPEVAGKAEAALREGRRASVRRRLVWHQANSPAGNPNAYTPVAFYSEDTHYSIIKIMRILNINTFYELGTNLYPGKCPINGGVWPQEVPSKDGALGPGSVDVEALAALVEFFASHGYPIIVCCNYGTTFKGAYDDVEKIGDTLLPILKKYGLDEREVVYDPTQTPPLKDTRTGYWIHVDGALGATYMPFIEMAHDKGKIARRGPNFDFRLPFVHSISTSGHKWVGAPFPTGLYMTKVKYQLNPPSNPAYIGSPDTTLAGSRSGLAPAVLWSYLATHSYDAQIERALRCEHLANYTHKKLKDLEDKLNKEREAEGKGKIDLWVQRTPLALTILFRQPSDSIVFKYTLSCETVPLIEGTENIERDYAHVYMMENVTEKKIDALIADLSEPGAFEFEPVESKADTSGYRAVRAPGAARAIGHVPHSGRGWR